LILCLGPSPHKTLEVRLLSPIKIGYLGKTLTNRAFISYSAYKTYDGTSPRIDCTKTTSSLRVWGVERAGREVALGRLAVGT
jgi:hypothetical protein